MAATVKPQFSDLTKSILLEPPSAPAPPTNAPTDSNDGDEDDPEANEDLRLVAASGEGRIRTFFRGVKARLLHDARYLPLLGAVAAPLSTLLDIPALAQPWYLYQGQVVPDPKACIALSAVSLSVNVLANIALMARFMVGEKHWKFATGASVVGWCIKLAVAIVNLALFGGSKRNQPGFEFSEGFWCAVASCALVGFIVLNLVVHSCLTTSTSFSHFLLHPLHHLLPRSSTHSSVPARRRHFLSLFHRGGTEVGRDERAKSEKWLLVRDSQRIRITGAKFISVVALFVFLIGVEALVFSQLEGWTYFNGIYFSLITVLTIGFGDIVPTTTAARILLFPFALLSIALLASLLGVFVDFLSTGSKERQLAWRKKYEEGKWATKLRSRGQGGAGEKSEGEKGGTGKEGRGGDLREEVEELRRLEWKEESVERVYQLVTSGLSLAVFWVVGAVLFRALEGFTYGQSMYFCYVSFLTVGYGDFSPETAGGRVFFVIWAIVAVPFVTNFVLNTVSSVMYSFTTSRLQQWRWHRVTSNIHHHSHAHYVATSHHRLATSFLSSNPSPMSSPSSAPTIADPITTDESRTKLSPEEQQALTRVVLGLALRFEAQATALLIPALEDSGSDHFLLRADRNLQKRALDVLASSREGEGGGEERYHPFVREAEAAFAPHSTTSRDGHHAVEAEECRESDGERGNEEKAKPRKRLDLSPAEEEQMNQVVEYRKTFAALLAAGSRLLDLKGEERYWFERRLENQHLSEGSS